MDSLKLEKRRIRDRFRKDAEETLRKTSASLPEDASKSTILRALQDHLATESKQTDLPQLVSAVLIVGMFVMLVGIVWGYIIWSAVHVVME